MGYILGGIVSDMMRQNGGLLNYNGCNNFFFTWVGNGQTQVWSKLGWIINIASFKPSLWNLSFPSLSLTCTTTQSIT